MIDIGAGTGGRRLGRGDCRSPRRPWLEHTRTAEAFCMEARIKTRFDSFSIVKRIYSPMYLHDRSHVIGRVTVLYKQATAIHMISSRMSCNHDCKPLALVPTLSCVVLCVQIAMGIERSGICTSCDYMFHKKLDIVDEAECPMCWKLRNV
jgi:hypothetical protein